MARTEEFNRDLILENAKHTFWLKGYNGTSMQDLVDATGLNRSSIYNSFGNKMKLYQTVLEKYKSENGAFFEKAQAKNRNAIETIGLIFLYALDEMKADTDKKGCMLINCYTEMGNQNMELQSLLEGNNERIVSIFKGLVDKGQGDGSIRTTEDSNLLAYYLVNSFQGFRITGMNTSDPKILKSIIQNILKTLA